MNSILNNNVLLSAVIAGSIAQIIKVILTFLTEKKIKWDRLIETGGMPSAHSAAVTALSVSLGMKYGWNSPLVAISFVFGYIVMYDATGVRQAAGKHAKLINELIDELGHLFDEGFQPKTLKTLLGHTLPQVFIGAMLGIFVAVLVMRNLPATV